MEASPGGAAHHRRPGAHGGPGADRAGRQPPCRAGPRRCGGPGRPGHDDLHHREVAGHAGALVVVMVAVLYHATPNVRQPKFRWVSVGATVAILGWVLASVAFGFYVSNFGSYNKTYGSLAGIIVFLLWLWITNLALLFGAEVDAELERARELQSGIEAERTLQLPPRDTRNSEKAEEKLDRRVAEGRRLRLDSDAAEGNGDDASGYVAGREHGPRGASHSSAAHELEPLPSERARARAERSS